MLVGAKDLSRERSRAAGARTCAAAAVLWASGLAGYALAQQESSQPSELHAPTSADEPAVGNTEEYEVLRRLLGVAHPEPAESEGPTVDAPANSESPPVATDEIGDPEDLRPVTKKPVPS